MMHRKKLQLLVMMYILLSNGVWAQHQEQVQWMSFEQMEQAFAQAPKKVFIDFWADWCAPCKRMDKYAFTNPNVIKKLNEEFYPVKMNVETTDTIYFGGKEFINIPTNDYHQLALLLGRNESGEFSLPTVAIYDQQFQLLRKYHKYLHSKGMLQALTF